MLHPIFACRIVLNIRRYLSTPDVALGVSVARRIACRTPRAKEYSSNELLSISDLLRSALFHYVDRLPRFEFEMTLSLIAARILTPRE